MLVTCPSCGHQIIPYLTEEECVVYRGLCTVCQAEISIRLIILKPSPLPEDVLSTRRMKGAKVEYLKDGSRKPA